MGTLTSPGLGSGLDVSSLVTALVNAETEPKAIQLNRKEASIQTKLTGLGQVQSAMSDFQSAVAGFKNQSGFKTRTTSVSEPEFYTATATKKAVAGEYAVTVNTLAKSHRIASEAFTNQDAVMGTGTLTFTFGTYDAGGPVLQPMLINLRNRS